MMDQAANHRRQSWQVPVESAGSRLDAFLRRSLPHLSRRVIAAAIEEKLFSINGKAGRKGDAVQETDYITFRGPSLWLETVPPPNASLHAEIVYEDEFLLAVDKPAGMATHGFSARDTHTLTNFLIARFPGLAGIGKSRWEPGIVHRLDRETSGIVLVAKSAAVFAELRQQFRRREVAKRYWALVWGDTDPAGSIEFPIAHHPGDKSKMCALVGASAERQTRKAWPALTRYCRLLSAGGKSVLQLDMRTGVTHQLRVHLAAVGHPIIGDRLYGSDHETFGLERHFLHAQGLVLRHPRNGRTIRLEAPLPADLVDVLVRLNLKD